MKEKNIKYKQLSETEMLTMYEMHEGGKTIREIAVRVKRSPGTVWRCLNYRPKDSRVRWHVFTAVRKAEYQFLKRYRPGEKIRTRKLEADPEQLRFIVETLIKSALSPEEISYRCSQIYGEVNGVSTKTIYNFIKDKKPELKIYFLEEGKPRQQRITHRRGKFKQAATPMRPIAERPEEVEKREEFGHFECDLLQLKSGYFLSVRERKTRYHILIPLRFKKSKLVKHTLIAYFAKLNIGVLRTITFDRGTEFAPSELSQLEDIFEYLQLYYCEAYKPYQKGSVENGHRWIRKFVKRGSEFSSYTQADVTHICSLVNRKPMKCLNRRTPEEMWNEELEFKLAA